MAARKTLVNWQFGVVGNEDGTATHPTLFGVVNEGRAPLVDRHGRLWVRVIDAGGGPAPSLACDNPVAVQDQSTALVAQEQITTGETLLAQCFGYNAGAATQFVQLHDIIVPIVLGNIPVITIPVPAETQYSISVPWKFANGVRIGLSTTGPTFTAAAAELWWNFLGTNCP